MAPATKNRPVVHDDLDDYGVDDFGADPFAESGDENANNTRADSQSKTRKDIGISEEVAVSAKVRAPRVKLDENRLLSEKGITKLRRKAGELKFKGKGHEWSDTARLLSMYQLWLDDLFPKAKFLDALAMVEKTGHSKRVRLARMEMINEGRPRSSMPDFDDADLFGETEDRDTADAPTRIAPIFQQGNGQSESERPRTPDIDDLFGDDDIYDATPRAARKNTQDGAGGQGDNAPDDEEDLDALMAEEEAQRNAPVSIFGNGQATQRPPQPPAEPDEDELDALMAEVESSSAPKKATGQSISKPTQPVMDDYEDDLDALMAEAEAEGAMPASKPAPPEPNGGADADEEAAMAEMDGLW